MEDRLTNGKKQMEGLEWSSINNIQSAITSAVRAYNLEKMHENIIRKTAREISGSYNFPTL